MSGSYGRSGNIEVTREDALKELIADGREASVKQQEVNESNNNDNSSEETDESVLIGNKHATLFHNWLCPESLHKVQTESNPDCRAVTAMCDQLLQTEEQFTNDVAEFMFDHDVLDLRRRELLYRKWNDRVYERIHGHVLSELNSNDFNQLLLHKRMLYNDYLAKCNRKEQISIDTPVEPVEGDARLPLKLSARFGQLNDPLLQSERTRIEEDRIEVQCITGERLPSASIQRLRLPPEPLVPLGRQSTTSGKPGTSSLICDIESEKHQRSRLKMRSDKNHSKVLWDCYYRSCPDDPGSAVKTRLSSTAAVEFEAEVPADNAEPSTAADPLEMESACGPKETELHCTQQDQVSPCPSSSCIDDSKPVVLCAM